MNFDEINEIERWEKIPGFFGIYSVSNMGRVRRDARGTRTYPGRTLIATPTNQGYMGVTLYIDGQRHSAKVHRLVMESFAGAPPPGMEINHKDGNKANNSLINLEYVTRKENINHAFKNLPRNIARGERGGCVRLSKDQVIAIRQSSAPDTKLSKIFGVCKSTIDNVRNRKTWAHIP